MDEPIDSDRAPRAPGCPQAMLTHKDVVRTIESALTRRGIPRQDREDGVANVQVRALERLRKRPAPADLPGWKKLCHVIAVAYAKDVRRKHERRAEYDQGPCEDPDAHVADLHHELRRHPVDSQRLLDILETHLRQAKVPDLAFTILEAKAAGDTSTSGRMPCSPRERRIRHGHASREPVERRSPPPPRPPLPPP